MIQVQNITKSFDGFRALDDLSFTVPHGAVYGLVGPNGAGKSTVLRCITGIYRPDTGLVSVGGLPVWENPAVKRRMAFIPDDLSAHAGDSIREMAGLMRKLYPRFDLEPLRTAARGLPARREKAASAASPRACRSRRPSGWPCCAKPDYLILDEPVDGLDPVMRRQIWSICHGGRRRSMSTTVLVSSHNLRELEDVCDHVGIMHHGQLLLERSLSDLQDNMVKVQLVTEYPIPAALDVVHSEQVGRIQTLIVRGSHDTVQELLAQCHPMLCDLLPLSLEEIFIYELGGVDYDVKNIVL